MSAFFVAIVSFFFLPAPSYLLGPSSNSGCVKCSDAAFGRVVAGAGGPLVFGNAPFGAGLSPTGVVPGPALNLGLGPMPLSVIANIGPVVLALAFATLSAGACRFLEGPVRAALVFGFWSSDVAGRFIAVTPSVVDGRVCFSPGPCIISVTRFLEGNGG